MYKICIFKFFSKAIKEPSHVGRKYSLQYCLLRLKTFRSDFWSHIFAAAVTLSAESCLPRGNINSLSTSLTVWRWNEKGQELFQGTKEPDSWRKYGEVLPFYHIKRCSYLECSDEPQRDHVNLGAYARMVEPLAKESRLLPGWRRKPGRHGQGCSISSPG